MARRAKKDDGGGVSAIRGNGFDPEQSEAFVQRVENVHIELAREKSEFMTRCKVLHGDIKDILDEAKGAGIPKKAIKQVVKKHALERKLEDLDADLEGQDLDDYHQLLSALGELDGRAPVQRAATAESTAEQASA